MHSLLERLLNKKGINSYADLKDEEQKTYDAWQSVLIKPEPSLADVATVLTKEMERITHERDNFDNTEKRDLYYKAYSRILKMLHLIITTPEKSRNELKAQLEHMLET